MTLETRSAGLWPDADFELRTASDGFTFTGYAAVFDRPSVPLRFAGVMGGREFREVILPGAFTRTLNAQPDVTLRYQHDMTSLPLARTRSGTMSLSEDGRGLRVEAVLPDNEWGLPVRDAISRGDISGMSFRFSAVNEAPAETVNGVLMRTLREVKLGPEVSVTDIPAYPDTSAAVRMASAVSADPLEVAAALRALAEPEAVLTAAQRAIVVAIADSRAAADPASAYPCCAACGLEDDCCETANCPPACTGCAECDNTVDAADAVSAPDRSAAEKLSEMRRRLAALSAR